MLAAYGVDVLDPGVSPRRVWELSQRLPPWARLPGEDWSTESHLLALLIDHVADLTWLVSQLGGSKSARPNPVQRPQPRREARPEPQPSLTWAGAAKELMAMPGVVVRHG